MKFNEYQQIYFDAMLHRIDDLYKDGKMVKEAKDTLLGQYGREDYYTDESIEKVFNNLSAQMKLVITALIFNSASDANIQFLEEASDPKDDSVVKLSVSLKEQLRASLSLPVFSSDEKAFDELKAHISLSKEKSIETEPSRWTYWGNFFEENQDTLLAVGALALAVATGAATTAVIRK
jgi:hypothetical protein